MKRILISALTVLMMLTVCVAGILPVFAESAALTADGGDNTTADVTLPTGVGYIKDESLPTPGADLDTYHTVETPDDAQPIEDADDFAAMAADGVYYLAADITVSATYAAAFKGQLWGEGHTITVSAPLFAQLDGATIRDIVIEGAVETNGYAAALALKAAAPKLYNVKNYATVTSKATEENTGITGGLIALIGTEDADHVFAGLEGDTILRYCANYATVSAAGFSATGGLIGAAYGLGGGGNGYAATNYTTFTAEHCFNQGAINAYGHTGGLVGLLGDYDQGEKWDGVAYSRIWAKITVNFCTNAGAITIRGDATPRVGGLFGRVDGSYTEIRNSVNSGAITDYAHGAGGIAGVFHSFSYTAGNSYNEIIWSQFNLIVDNCVNEGTVTAEGAGGFAYANYAAGRFTNSVNKGDVYGSITNEAGSLVGSCAGGFFAYAQNSSYKILNCLNEGYVEVGAGSGGAGGFVGNTTASFSLENCTNNGEVYYKNFNDAAGMIAELTSGNGDIWEAIACVNNGKITGTRVGGVFGQVENNNQTEGTSNDGILTMLRCVDCVNTGELISRSSAGEGQPAAGIVGSSNKDIKHIEMIRCTNYADISGCAVAGILANWNRSISGDLTVEDCVNYGNLSRYPTTGAATQMAGIALIGAVGGNITVRNCRNYGDLTNSEDGGGMLCINGGAVTGSVLIENCYNGGDIADSNRAGGILGSMGAVTGTFTMRNCVNEGDISSSGNYCGGVCGRLDPNGANSIFESCLNTGDVVAKQSQVGGILGYSAGTDGVLTFKNCVNLGTIGAADKNVNAAGIMGSCDDNWKYTSCYNGGTILAGANSASGIANDQATTFTDCVNAGTVTGGKAEPISLTRNNPHTFTSCYNYGSVNGTAGTDAFILPKGVTRVIMPDGSLMVVPATVVDMLMQVHADEYEAPTLVVDAENLTATSVADFKAAIKAKYPVAEIPEGAVAISTPDEFKAMTAGGVYYLENDLDLTGGEYIETFSGTLYGNGKTITIKRALFTYISDLAVRDVTFEGTTDPTDSHGGAIANAANGGEITFINVTNNASIESTANSAGGLLGYASGATLSAITMQGCINTATILANTANTKRAGGLFGHVESAPNVSILFTDCLNTGAITSKQVSGGILGWADGGAGGLITNVMNTGEINAEYAGGVAGAFYTTVTVYNAYNSGAIPQGSNAGGIFGAAYNGNFALRHVGNTGDVTVTTGSSGAGGIIGLCKVYTYMTLTDSFNTGSVVHNNKNDAAGAIGEFNSQNTTLAPIVTIKHFTNTGDVTTTTRAGGVLGQVFSNLDVRMTSCYNSGDMTGGDIGGMVGMTNGGTNHYRFIDCHNSGDMQSTSRPGGILGTADVNGNLTFINCSNSGKIVSTGNYAGGIAGRADTASEKHVLYKNCVNTGEVVGKRQYAGGIMGYAGDNDADQSNQMLFYSCYNSGAVSVGDQTGNVSNAGGIAGSSGSGMDFFDCVNTGNVTSGRIAGGIVGNAGKGGTALFQCVSTGDIHTRDVNSGDKSECAGGLLGYQYGEAFAIGCTVSGTISADYQNINDTDEAGRLRGVGAIIGYANNANTQVRFCVFTGTLDANGAAEYFANYAPDRDLATYDVEAYYYGNVSTVAMPLVYMNDSRTGQCELYGEVEVISVEEIELGTAQAALPPYVLVRDCNGKTYLVASQSAENFKTTLTVSHVYDNYVCSDGFHWQVCLCGEKLHESKAVHEMVYVHDETGHWLQCEVCDHVAANTEPSEHGFGQQFDETNHWDECAVCHRQENVTEHVANFGYDDDKHWFACDNCDYATTGEDHSHETQNYNGDTHWMECICGHIDETTRAEHTYEYTNNGDGTHSVDCACGYHKSDDAHESVQQSDSTAHWDWCVICDALVDGTYIEHDVKYLATAEGHQMGCTGCDYILSPVYEHEFDFRRGEDSHWSECPYCGYVTDDTAHIFDTFVGDANGHRAACECGYADPNAELLPHNHGGIDNGDGTHAVACPDCGYQSGESEYHVWMAVRVDNYYHGYVCSVCGMADETRTQVPHRHDLTTLVYDETNHWYACECGDVRNGELIPHTFGEFLHDENGHWKVCECGAISEAGEHTGGQADCMSQAVCTTCGTSYGALIADNHAEGCEKVYDQKTQTTHAGYWSDCKLAFEAEAHSFDAEHVCSICGYACLHDGTFTYTEGESANNHTKTCNLCGKAEQEACTDGADGSTATCQKKADCIHCKREYGEIADHNYDLDNWSNLVEEGVEYHYHACLTEGCTYTEKDKAACSDGQDNATATCTAKPVCAVCAKEYGTVNEDAHTSTEFKYAINGSRHDKIHVCCDRVAATEAHTEGTAATCTTKAVCAVCGFEYGDVDAFAHTGTLVAEITKETHGFRYDCCNFYHIPAVAHTFVNGKCTLVGCDYECAHDAEDIVYVENALAEGATETTHNKVCDHCGKVLEENLAHDFTGEWKTDADKHWKECVCGAIAQEAAHSLKWVDLGDGTCHQICETCNYESVAAQDHVLGEFVNTDETNHWKVCGNCEAVVGTTAHVHVATKVEGNTETHDMVCECGHKAEAVAHDFTGEWKTDADKHWKECVCGAIAEEAAHQLKWVDLGEGKCHQICETCNYESVAAQNHVLGEFVNTDETNHWKVCQNCEAVVGTTAHVHVATKVEGNTETHDMVCECGHKAEAVAHDFTGEWKTGTDGHWHECVCGATDTVILHTPKWVDLQDGTCHQICEVCNYEITAATAHVTGAFQSDDENHWKVCENCAATVDQAAHGFTASKAGTEEDGYHTLTCEACEKTKFEACNDGADGATATCQQKAVCTACQTAYGAFADHAYDLENWSNVTEGSTDYHYHACTTEGCTNTDKDKAACSDGQNNATATCTAKAVCAVCAKEYGSVNADMHTGQLVADINEDTHRFYYDCCNFDHIIETEHTFVDGKCEVVNCDYVCQHPADAIVYVENDLADGAAVTTHNAVCSKCNKVLEENLTHEYKLTMVDETTHSYLCACGAGEASGSHELDWKIYTEGEHAGKHVKACACGYEEGTPVEHSFNTWFNTDGENHWKTCECGAESEKTAHNHVLTAIPGVDDAASTAHHSICECGHVDGEAVDHTYVYEIFTEGDYAGMHQGTCACGVKESETPVAHDSVDPATAANCQSAAVCVCGTTYGEVDLTKHASEELTVGQDQGAQHAVTHACCGADAGLADHVYDQVVEGANYGDAHAASCVCGATGGVAEHTPAGYASNGAAHWQVCGCGYIFAETLAKHDTTTAPSCTSKGVCSVCGEYDAANSDNHSGTITWTTTATQHSGTWSCCNTTVSGENHTFADGKCSTCAYTCQHTFGDWTETKAATTTEKGEKKHTCSTCGFAETAEIPVLTTADDGANNNNSNTNEPTEEKSNTALIVVIVCVAVVGVGAVVAVSVVTVKKKKAAKEKAAQPAWRTTQKKKKKWKK